MRSFKQILSSQLIAKLSPPTTSHAQVPRSVLWNLVRFARQARLIVLRAPAGFGKTTTMAQIQTKMDKHGVATSWLTLDKGDNDVSRFMKGLTAAVSKIMQGQDLRASVGLQQSSVVKNLAAVDQLSSCQTPFALFLDDFHCIDEPKILRIVDQIIEQLSPVGRIILGCRTLPAFKPRLVQGSGQILEIDSHLLRFSMAETTNFFTVCRGQPLQPDDIYSLQRKTEGWASALEMVSIALSTRPQKSEFIAQFSGSNQAIADYLANEVFASQPPDVQEFLLKTCIARHLTAPLCDVLTNRLDSEAILKRLEATGLFLASIEAKGEMIYRYHSLFTGFLRDYLAHKQPDEVQRLNRVAAKWYESENRPVPAIDHALASGDHKYAVKLLSQNAENLLAGGRSRLLQRWLSHIQLEMLEHDPVLELLHVWSVFMNQGPIAAASLLKQKNYENLEDSAYCSHLAALRQMILNATDHYEEAIISGRDTLLDQPKGKSFADSIGINTLGYSFYVMGQAHKARKLWHAERQLHQEDSSQFNTMLSQSMEGIADLLEGQLRQAAARFRVALGATRTMPPTYMGAPLAGVLYANVLYETDECEQAERLLNVYMPLVEEAGMPDTSIIGNIMLARIAFDRGNVDRAYQFLSTLEQMGVRRELPRLVATAKLARSHLMLLGGDLQAAKEEMSRADDRKMWQWARSLRLHANDLVYPELCELRWDIWSGNIAKALAGLEQEISVAVAASRNYRALKLRLLQSVALNLSGDHAGSLTLIGDVLRMACAEGFKRLILDEGEVVGTLVRQFENMNQEMSFQRPDPIFTDYLQRLLQSFDAMPSYIDSPNSTTDTDTPVPLTRKEIGILKLVAEGHTNIAMAQKLYLSVNTIRTHMRNINDKLAASNRTQAVAIARRLHLIG